MKITLLGCGTSFGVPRIGGGEGGSWGAADPNNPKNRRRRSSILVQEAGKTLLIDTSPDLREQMLSAHVERLDGVLYTHDHADHTHGIDDLRALSYAAKAQIPVYADTTTLAVLTNRFDYIFADKGGYRAICGGNDLGDGPDFASLTVAGVPVQPFAQDHGRVRSLGYRFGRMAYSTDVNGFPQASERHLEGLDLWIVDALRYDPHPTHTHLAKTLAWIERFKPKRAILTHMTGDMDYETLKAALPDGVEPGYDGLVIEL